MPEEQRACDHISLIVPAEGPPAAIGDRAGGETHGLSDVVRRLTAKKVDPASLGENLVASMRQMV